MPSCFPKLKATPVLNVRGKGVSWEMKVKGFPNCVMAAPAEKIICSENSKLNGFGDVRKITPTSKTRELALCCANSLLKYLIFVPIERLREIPLIGKPRQCDLSTAGS